MASGVLNKRNKAKTKRKFQFPKRKAKIKSSVNGYCLTPVKFACYAAKNAFALVLGSIFSFIIPIVVYTLKLTSITEFTFIDAFENVFYGWLYDDVFISILTLGITLVITYIWSFKREAEGYLGESLRKVVNTLVVVCLLLCFLMLVLEIIYVWHNNGTNIGQLIFYTRVETMALVVCCFLQNFSHPEYYMSPSQSN